MTLNASHPCVIRDLGLVQYLPTWEKMQAFTVDRNDKTTDEIWLLEHPSVFTQGQAGKQEHLLMPGDIPVIQVDRGGQVTYHGPGQFVAYVLLDLSRYGSDIRALVTAMENSIIRVLAKYSVDAAAKKDAPGVYVDDAKICSLGLRVKKGKSFHGLALNVDMDLSPFSRINPCGYADLTMAQLSQYSTTVEMAHVKQQWVEEFCSLLSIQPIFEPPLAST